MWSFLARALKEKKKIIMWAANYGAHIILLFYLKAHIVLPFYHFSAAELRCLPELNDLISVLLECHGVKIIATYFFLFMGINFMDSILIY